MATLVLGAVGGLIGGPVGAAIGSALGQRFDQMLLAPKGRRGPRMNDLAVQSSTYGAAIPKIFGVMRVSGSVIWSTDLIETRKKQGNGKGRPKTTTYSYAASFAVALSARPVVRVGRIWADGRLLRGSAGDFKTETGFRLHRGLDDQAPDPLIAAAEGVEQAPAYRGLAYAVFEDFQLGDYGNRIPSLSFEVIADEAPVTVGAIARALIPSLDGTTTGAVDGFAATGDSVRGAIEALAGAFPLSLRDDGGMLSISDQPGAASIVREHDLGARSDEERAERIAVMQRGAATTPEALILAYYDPARDYQGATQTARRDGGARVATRVDLPAALQAEAARGLCDARLSRNWAERLTARVTLTPASLGIAPGATVTIPGHPALWRVAGTSFEGHVVRLDLVRLITTTIAAPASSGRHLGEADLAHGPTQIVLLDLPPLGDAPATTPHVAVAAAGSLPGWRRAALSVSRDNGASWQDAGSTAAPARMGSADSVLGTGTSAIVDRISTVEITMRNANMELNDANLAGLLRGDNLALLGNEAFQFGRAEPIAPGRWRLSQLLRGRRGTEWAMAGHVVGEAFVLLEPDALAALEAPAQSILSVMASGIGDTTPATAQLTVAGHALRPLSPCHVRAKRQPNGDTGIAWVRRSRSGWHWPDAVDTPLGEELERYAVGFALSNGVVRTIETSQPHLVYTAADRAADIAAGAVSATLSIRQTGQFAQSLPAEITIPLT